MKIIISRAFADQIFYPSKLAFTNIGLCTLQLLPYPAHAEFSTAHGHIHPIHHRSKPVLPNHLLQMTQQILPRVVVVLLLQSGDSGLRFGQNPTVVILRYLVALQKPTTASTLSAIF